MEVDDAGRVLRLGQCDPDEEVLPGAIVPGFVNAHCHIELSFLRGIFRKGSGMAGFIDQINELRDSQTPEQKNLALSTEMDALWAQGVQAMADISNCDDSFGVKALHPIYTRTFLEVFGDDPARCDDVMSGVLALQEKAKFLGLDAAPSPHACYTMSPELLTASSVAGLQSGFLSYHCEESAEEVEMLEKGSGPMWDNRVRNGLRTPPVTGESPLEYFANLVSKETGTPVPGNVLLVHECCLTAQGAAFARRMFAHPFIAVCPLSNLFIHKTLPPIPLMRESGIPICIGTDSLSSNDALNMVDEMYCLQQAFPGLSLGEMLSWACLNGARFLGKEAEMGSIGPGKTPGIVYVTACEGGVLTPESKSLRLC